MGGLFPAREQSRASGRGCWEGGRGWNLGSCDFPGLPGAQAEPWGGRPAAAPVQAGPAGLEGGARPRGGMLIGVRHPGAPSCRGPLTKAARSASVEEQRGHCGPSRRALFFGGEFARALPTQAGC